MEKTCQVSSCGSKFMNERKWAGITDSGMLVWINEF